MAVARRVVEEAIGEKLDGSPLPDNFGRVHQTLRVTPAMEAGVSDHVWSIEEIVALLG